MSSNAQVTSLSLPIGSGVQAGDVIFVVAAWNATATGTTYTTPTGFTIISATTDSGPSAVCSVGTFYKISDGTEAGTSITITHSVTGRCAATSAAFTGVNGLFDGAFPTFTSDNGAAGGQTSEPSPTLSGLTQATDVAVLLLGAKQDVASATACTFTAPSGYSVAIQASGTSSAGNNGAAAIGYKIKTDTADETSPTWATNEAVHWLSVSAATEALSGSSSLNQGWWRRVGPLAMRLRPLEQSVRGGASLIIAGSVSADTLVSAPAATAAASAPVPGVNISVLAPAATASASAPAPSVGVGVLAPAATAAASAPLPTLQLQVSPGAATANASAPLPIAPAIAAPASSANASAPLPAIQLAVLPPAATASASALVPIVTAAPVVAPPAATASASAPVPGIDVRVLPGAATASASAPTPIVSSAPVVAPPAATASASAPIPAIQVTVLAPVATANASAPVPIVTAAPVVAPPAATAAASALVPAIQIRLVPPAMTAAASAPLAAPGVSLLPPAGTAAASAKLPTLQLVVSSPAALAAGLALVATVTGSGLTASGIVIRRTYARGSGGDADAISSAARSSRAGSAASAVGAAGLGGETEAVGTSGETSV